MNERKCAQCGCMVKHIGICAGCAEKNTWAAHWSKMGGALRSIPEHYRDARWGSHVLRERVYSLTGEETPIGIMGHRITVLHGPTGAGKTTLACALLRWVVETTSPTSPEHAILHAQRARFVDARDVPPTREGPGEAKRAEAASLLVLDDVGQEAGHGDGYADMARATRMGDLLNALDKRERQVIVTTYGTPDSWARLYGAGISRRFWDAPDVNVVKLEAPPREATSR